MKKIPAFPSGQKKDYIAVNIVDGLWYSMDKKVLLAVKCIHKDSINKKD